MKFGICSNLNAASVLTADSFDFIEVNVQKFLIPELEDHEFQPQLDASRSTARPVKSANCFLPASLKCVGPDIDRERLVRYATKAFSRAELTGIETIVFGSGDARMVPADYTQEKALEDFNVFLCAIGPIAQRHNITLVVEPLNKKECNFINTVAEGAAIVERCNHPNVRLLADSYHMFMNEEPVSEITRFGGLIRHIHLAELAGRYFPGKSKEDFRPVFHALRQIGYDGRIALECSWEDIQTDIPRSISYLRQQMDG